MQIDILVLIVVRSNRSLDIHTTHSDQRESSIEQLEHLSQVLNSVRCKMNFSLSLVNKLQNANEQAVFGHTESGGRH